MRKEYLVLIGLVVFMLISATIEHVLYYLYIYPVIEHSGSLNEFSTSLERGSNGFTLLFISTTIFNIALGLFSYHQIKSTPIIQEVKFCFAMIIIIGTCKDLITCSQYLTKPMTTTTERILNDPNEKLSSLKVRVYFYNYFAQSNNQEGMKLVIKHGLERLHYEDMDYLIQHRKDKAFPPLKM